MAFRVVLPAQTVKETWLLDMSCSDFSAEVLGIQWAVNLSVHLNTPMTIILDGKSVFQSVANVNFSSPAVIIDLAATITSYSTPLEIGWAPGHVGIHINEAADQAATHDTPIGSWWRPLMACDLICQMRKSIIRNYTNTWSTILWGKNPTHLRPFIT
ncbi:uncharacterized protein LOC111639626 [Centruroides sculpturatus]|uniref:uncharacterized protein LOC111639626 n=1 Tax=Centruroides sculpturatus TaxID=218467 RepID=UPI000C6EC7D1|nr:uncharacterized protein LOC111639626 [Centruroides sculpturatus]